MKAINEYLIQVSSSKTSHVCTDNDNNRFQATWEDGATGHVARCWEDPAYSTSCCMSGQIYSVEHPAYSTSCCMNFYCLSELHEACCLCELHESCCLCELHESCCLCELHESCCLCDRVGHCVLFRSECSVLSRSFKECSVLFRSFIKNVKERKDHSVLL